MPLTQNIMAYPYSLGIERLRFLKATEPLEDKRVIGEAGHRIGMALALELRHQLVGFGEDRFGLFQFAQLHQDVAVDLIAHDRDGVTIALPLPVQAKRLLDQRLRLGCLAHPDEDLRIIDKVSQNEGVIFTQILFQDFLGVSQEGFCLLKFAHQSERETEISLADDRFGMRRAVIQHDQLMGFAKQSLRLVQVAVSEIDARFFGERVGLRDRGLPFILYGTGIDVLRGGLANWCGFSIVILLGFRREMRG